MSQAQYAQVLRQALPQGAYETAPDCLVAKETSAHAQALHEAAVAADRVLEALSGVPVALLAEFERDMGLPSGCRTLAGDVAGRIGDISNAVLHFLSYTDSGLQELFDRFGVDVLAVRRYAPLPCTAPCTQPLDTVRSRFRLSVQVDGPVMADLTCVIRTYLPASWRVDIEEV